MQNYLKCAQKILFIPPCSNCEILNGYCMCVATHHARDLSQHLNYGGNLKFYDMFVVVVTSLLELCTRVYVHSPRFDVNSAGCADDI